MILIADSGSTKTDWVLIDAGGETGRCVTIGLNPHFNQEEDVAGAVSGQPMLQEAAGSVEAIYFYGAGCSSPGRQEIIARGLKSVFPGARIVVDHDLTAAVYALYDGEPCIACILGTGSNSTYTDGHRSYQEVPSLGYVLGDEGSGAYYGKLLLRDFLYLRMPQLLHEEFAAEFGLEKEAIFERVYRQPNANVWLASFAPFLTVRRTHTYVREMVLRGMAEFLDMHVRAYPMHSDVPVHFAGSLASIFETELREAATARGIRIGRIVRKPIDNLVQYHLAQWQSGK